MKNTKEYLSQQIEEKIEGFTLGCYPEALDSINKAQADRIIKALAFNDGQGDRKIKIEGKWYMLECMTTTLKGCTAIDMDVWTLELYNEKVLGK